MEKQKEVYDQPLIPDAVENILSDEAEARWAARLEASTWIKNLFSDADDMNRAFDEAARGTAVAAGRS